MVLLSQLFSYPQCCEWKLLAALKDTAWTHNFRWSAKILDPMPSPQPCVDVLVAAVAGEAVPARLHQSPLLPVLGLSSGTRRWGRTCGALSRWATHGWTKYQNMMSHFHTLGYYKLMLLFGMVKCNYSLNDNWKIYSGFPDLHDFHFSTH